MLPVPDRPGDLLNALEDGVRRADTAVGAAAPGSGTTLTAGVWTGDRLALAHVGDGRAYLLRDGELVRLTRDHTVVQARVEAGELDPAEAAAHAVVPEAEIRSALVAGSGPGDTVRVLAALAEERGGPDDVSCVVADVVPARS